MVNFVTEWLYILGNTLALNGILLGVERLRPIESQQPWPSLIGNLLWLVPYTFLTQLLMSWLSPWSEKIISLNADHKIVMPLAESWLGDLALSLLGLFLFDVFYYWFHRCQHSHFLLWLEHRFHHTEQHLNTTSTLREHWLEHPLRLFLINVPTHMFFDIPTSHHLAITLSLMLWGNFNHLNLKLHFGWLSYVIANPQTHRIHHSRQLEHLNKNFAAFFPVIDLIFGTYYYPQADTFPPTGLPSMRAITPNG